MRGKNIIICALFAILLILSFKIAMSASIPSDYLAYWKFDNANGSNSTFAPDETWKFNGSVFGGAVNGSAGRVGESYVFNATNGYINATNYNITANISAFAWMNTKITNAALRYVVGKQSSSSSGWYIRLETSNKPSCTFVTGAGGAANTSAVLATIVPTVNTWYHVGCIFNGTNAMIYINGVLNNITSWAGPKNLTPNGLNIAMGKYALNSNYYWNGSIDEVIIYNRSLSIADAGGIYDSYFGFAVALSQPANDAVFSQSKNVSLNFSVSGDINSYNCSLSVNTVFNQTNNLVQNNTITAFNLNVSSAATYYWNVSCTNRSINNFSETRNFTFEKVAYLSSNNAIGYTSVESCFDAINNTNDGCVLGVSNYSETFSSPKYYNFSLDNGFVLSTYSQSNVSIDFSNMSADVLSNFAKVSDNQSFSNLNISGVSVEGFEAGNAIASLGIGWNNVIISNFDYCIHNDGTGFQTAIINNSQFSCNLLSLNTYSHDQVYNTRILRGGYILSSWGSPVIFDNVTFQNISINSGVGVTNMNITNSLFNYTVLGQAVGDYDAVSGNTFVCPANADAISINSNSVTISNNTFQNCGNLTYTSQYLSSYSPMTYGGNNFNTAVIFVSSNLGTNKAVSADNTDVSTIADGTNNFRLWLVNIPAASIPFSTLYVADPPAMSCAAVASAYGGTCYFDEADYFVANGTADYITNPASSAAIMPGYTSPAYLKYSVLANYNAVPLRNSGANNNITGNTFASNTAPFLINGTGTNLWLNSFQDFTPINLSDYTACINSEGNFYQESLATLAGDCGQSNVTVPNENQKQGTLFSLGWKKQSSIFLIFYDIFIKKIDQAFALLGTTNDTNYTLNVSQYDVYNYTLKLVPYINGSRVNGTNVLRNFEIGYNHAPNITSIFLNSTSIYNRSTDNLTAAYSVSDFDTDNVSINYNWYRNGASETVLNMPFTAPDANNQTYDFSAFSNPGTAYNGSRWNATAGHDGFGAFDFDGVNGSYIYISNPVRTLTVNSFAISLWIKPQGLQSRRWIFEWGDSMSVIQPWVGLLKYSNTTAEWFVLGGYNNLGTINVSDDSWYHLVMVYTGTSVSGIWNSYVNGVLSQAVAGNRANGYGAGHIYIGSGLNGSFNGTIDDFRVYNRSLSASEVFMLYNNGPSTLHSEAINVGDNWSVKATPIDLQGLNGSGVFSNNITINQNYPPSISSITLNSTSGSNLTTDNLTATSAGVSDPEGDAVTVNYNWYRNGVSDAVVNLPFAAPDSSGKTHDFSGNGNDGLVTSGNFSSTGGHDGFGAFEFNAVITSMINVSVDLESSDYNSSTVSVWFNKKSTRDQMVWSDEKGRFDKSLELDYFNTDNRICLYNGTSRICQIMNNHGWLNAVAVFYPNNTAALYVNGSLVMTINTKYNVTNTLGYTKILGLLFTKI